MWRTILALLFAISNIDRAWSDTIYVTRVEPTGRPGDVDWYTDQYDLQGNRLGTLIASRDIWDWGFFRGPYDYVVDATHDRFYIGWGHISLIDLTTREQSLMQRSGGYDSMALTPNGGLAVHEFRATFADVIHGFSILDRPVFVDWVQTGIEDGIIALDSHRNIYVTGPRETEILVFDRAGSPRGVFAQGVTTPTDMLFDR